MLRKTRLYIKSGVILLLLFILLSTGASAQYSIYSTLTNTYDSGVNWVDLDGDGDLDLSISGSDLFLTTGQGKLYLNSSGTLTYKRDIRPMLLGDQVWSDFNNDGYPDLLYAGTNEENVQPTAGIDIFSNFTTYDYSSLTGDFTPVYNGSVAWGDYDNDGDYDVLICGEDASGNVIGRLYSNSAGTFSVVNSNLPGIINGKVGFIDYDLDQDLDIFLTGRDINSNKYTRLWKNTRGIYTVTDDHFINLEYSQFDWGDFNDDGYPDLLLGGYDNTSGRGLLYINNSGNSFTLSDLKVPLAQRGTSAFGDVDNDGDLDAFVSGYKVSPLVQNRYIFINNGTDSLVPTSFTSTYVSRSYFNFGDYDNDNDLDFVSNGANSDFEGVTIIAENTTGTANQKPSTPLNLIAVVEGKAVRLMWDHSTDNNTPQKSLTYNIYMGTGSGGTDVVSPNADISTGFRRISRQGYIQDTAWTITDLPVGTYYWGVQAIDNSLGASAFSSESTFEIKERFSETSYSESTVETSPAIYFDCDHDNDLDMVLNTTSTFMIAENQSGFFSEGHYQTIMPDGYNPIKTITPLDYDNDNLMDFSVSGNYTVNGLLDSTIALFGYKNPFEYEIIDSALIKDASFEYVLWADLNNDGRQDAVTSGKTTNLGVNNKPVTYILQNISDGIFQEVNHSIRGFEKCNAVAGDFDNDMDVDIIIYGKDSMGIPSTYIYFNEGGFDFNEVLIPNNELFRQYLSFGIMTGDYDLNGELDIYMSGVNELNDNYARVLLNNNMNFTDANLPIRSSFRMSSFWADYDYDGDLDIFSTSLYNPPNKTWLYLNNDGILNEITIDLGDNHKLDLPFMVANLDNMNGLDFIMKINYGNYIQYHDNWGSNIRITEAPANLGFDQDKLDIILKWDKLSDCPGCTYNIRVGTSEGGVDVMSPMADVATGYRYVVGPGNAYLNGSWKLSDLSVGKYYWSVQAVDPSNTGGLWAPESTFTVSHIDADFTFTINCLGNSTVFTDMTVASDPVTKWKWNFGDGSTSTLANPLHLYESAGTFDVGLWAYTVIGDSAFVSHSVQVKAAPIANFSANIACQGTVTFFTNSSNTDGVNMASWLWNFGDGSSSVMKDPGSHGYLNPMDYQVTLKAVADNGCSDLITKTVTVAGYPGVGVTASAPLIFCKGDSVKLSVPYNNKYSYNWMSGGAGLPGGDSSVYVAKLTGNYIVEVINTIGNCRDTSAIVTVTAQDAPAAPLITAGGPTVFCEGDSVVLSVINTPGYTYLWKRDGGEVGTTYKHVAKSTGKYSLTVTNSTGCKTAAVDTISVTVNTKPSLPTINISGATTFCEGSSVELSVSNNPALTYNWENNGIAITGATAYNYNVQYSGIYSLKITNANGCHIKSENITVNVLTAPSAPLISASKNPEFCEGDSVVLSVTNIAGYSYEWKLNGGAVGVNSNQLTARSSGSYDLVLKNAAGCSVASSNKIDVKVNDAPTPGNISLDGDNTFCEGGSVTLSVPVTTGYTYHWRNESGLITGAEANSYTATKSGTYELEISNASGCTARTLPVTITVDRMPDKPVLASTNYTAGVCPGVDPIRLSISNTGSGYSYMWIKNGELQYNDTLKYIEFYEKGIYKVRAELGKCSIESEPFTITLPDAPEKPGIYIRGPVVWYMAASTRTAGHYQWYRNDEQIAGATKYIYVANKTLGTYKVAVGNQNECYTMSDDITIPVPLSKMTNFYVPKEYLVGEDKDLAESIRLYPNPTTGVFTVEMENSISGEIVIGVITEQGKEIRNIKSEKTTEHFITEIDLSDEPKGVYFIKLRIDNYLETRKVIIE